MLERLGTPLVIAMFVSAGSCHGRRKTSRTAADQGSSTDDQQHESRETPHEGEPIVGRHMRQQSIGTTNRGFGASEAGAIAVARATNC